MDTAAEAEVLKRQGNALFQRKEFDAAVAAYSQALERLQVDLSGPARQQLAAALHLNRAWAVLEAPESALADWKMAEDDCSEVIKRDPACVKALYRRAMARERLRDLSGALRDAEDMKALEPKNPSVEPLLFRLASLVAAKPKPSSASDEPSDSLTAKMDRISIVETPHNTDKAAMGQQHMQSSKEEADIVWRALQEEESKLRRIFKSTARKQPSRSKGSAASRINANPYALSTHGEISEKTDELWALLGEEETRTMTKAFSQSTKSSREAPSRQLEANQ